MRQQVSKRLKRLWAVAPVATVILILSLAAATLFGVRSAVFWITRPPLAERELAIAAWMTPRYIARSWGVPPKVVLEAIDAPIPAPDGPMSLKQLAEYRGVTIEQIIDEAQAAITAFRSNPRK